MIQRNGTKTYAKREILRGPDSEKDLHAGLPQPQKKYNKGQVKFVAIRDHHERIIDRETWDAV